MSSSSLPDGIPEWVAALRERYDLTAEQIPTDAVLKLAAVAAHSVTRPAAPLTTYVAGLIAGTRGGEAADIDELIAELAVAARNWESVADIDELVADLAEARDRDGDDTSDPDGEAGPQDGDR